MADRRPGVIVVGTGHGCRVHVPAFRNAGMDVVAVVGRDPERTARRAQRAGVERSASSLEEALRLPGGDVVVISTPPDTHAALAEEAITAGRHVLVEKPFTSDAGQAHRLQSLAEQAGVVALVGHEFRFDPARITLRHALASGLVGEPRLAALVGHSAFAASLDLRMPAWWFDRDRGGGWLGAAASHLIDATRFWLGEFESVSASLPMVSGRDPVGLAEDTVSARFRMRSGCEGVIQQSASVWGRGLNLVRVAGPEGTAELVDGGVRLSGPDGDRLLDPVGPPPLVEVEEGSDPRNPFSHVELPPATIQAAVMRDLVAGRRPHHPALEPAGFADGVAGMEVIDAMRRSAAQGGAVVTVGQETQGERPR